MLTRIYGTAFLNEKDLDAHLEQIEQAKENDHRKLGPELDLFMLRPEAPGMPFWLPNGSRLLELMEEEVRGQLRKRGYQEIRTPAGPRRGAVAPLGPLGQLQGEHVLRRVGEPPVRAEADELPRRLPRLRLDPPLLPRAAAAPRRVRRRLPQRARGRAPRPAPRPRLHPGRRPRLLHRGADRGRGDRHPRGDRRALRAVRVRGRAARALDAGPRSRSAPTSSGRRPRRR